MEQFSLEAQKILSFAESIAFHFAHGLIGSEHVLLSFLKDKNHVFTRNVSEYKVTYDALQKKIKAIYPHRVNEPLYMEYTIELKVLLERAVAIGRKFHEEPISSKSLAIALLEETNCAAYELLVKYKVPVDALIATLEASYSRLSELDQITDLHNLSTIKKDPLIGREEEVEQLIHALSRRNKPNAILVGEPGVGKTAIVEELAARLKREEIPTLKGKMIYELDLASTVGGTKYRGEFEEKIKKIIKKVREDGQAILFIDEIHNVVKAGGAEGAIDASNILKPYLSRGEIQIIGATTEDEFQQVFEKDKPLKRRFQVIKVNPSSAEETLTILTALRPIYEKHYQLSISDAVIQTIVNLSNTFLPTLFFPDKAIDILDNACVMAKGNLQEENVIQMMESFYKIKINFDCKAKVVSSKLRQEIFGQEQAITAIENQLRAVDAHLIDQEKPINSMLFLGPSGVGKTQIARRIGEIYFGKDAFVYLDMSSFQDPTSLSKLIGTAPGYQGSEEGSAFVRNLKAHPHSLILLDEIEKANNEVLDFFLNILDTGSFQDGKGRSIDVRNCMIIMTSNYGFDQQTSFRSLLTRSQEDERKMQQKLQERFRFEFLSRIDAIIPFTYLSLEARKEIAQRYLHSFPTSFAFEASNDLLLTSKEDDYAKYGARLVKKDVKKAILAYLENKITN